MRSFGRVYLLRLGKERVIEMASLRKHMERTICVGKFLFTLFEILHLVYNLLHEAFKLAHLGLKGR